MPMMKGSSPGNSETATAKQSESESKSGIAGDKTISLTTIGMIVDEQDSFGEVDARLDAEAEHQDWIAEFI